MRSFKLALLALLIATPCSAQITQTGAGHVANGGGGAGFQGPGDIISGAVAFYSAGRAYNAAYAAAQSPLADIVDTTTGLATCTFNVGTNGFANLSAVVCPTASPIVSVTTFCTVTHVGCSITKLYDQTGNGNHVVQATLANMPALTFNAQNGLPCAAGTGNAAVGLATAGSITQAQPVTYTSVAERSGSFTTGQYLFSNASSTARLQYATSTNTIQINNGATVSLTASDSAPHAILIVALAANPLFAIDSAQISADHIWRDRAKRYRVFYVSLYRDHRPVKWL